MQSRIGIIALALAAGTLLLSGCLVEKDDFSKVQANKIQRTTDKLRVYKAGDFIEYNVQAERFVGGNPNENLTGTLKVKWESTSALRRPVTNETIIALKEITTLTYHNSDSPSDDGNTVRYITQDANGQITLHALDTGSSNTYYWLSSSGDADLTKTDSHVVFQSPIILETPPKPLPKIEFYVMEGCDDETNCKLAVGRFDDTQEVVGESKEIPTNIGTFTNPFEITSFGNARPQGGNVPQPIIDFRVLCSTDTNSAEPVAFGFAGNRRMWVMPEIGMIQLSNTCNESGSDPTRIDYTLTLSNTNIPLP